MRSGSGEEGSGRWRALIPESTNTLTARTPTLDSENLSRVGKREIGLAWKPSGLAGSDGIQENTITSLSYIFAISYVHISYYSLCKSIPNLFGRRSTRLSIDLRNGWIRVSHMNGFKRFIHQRSCWSALVRFDHSRFTSEPSLEQDL